MWIVNDPPEKILNFSRTLEIMVICASEETGRPSERAQVLIASEDFFLYFNITMKFKT